MTTIKTWRERMGTQNIVPRAPEHRVYDAMQAEIDELRAHSEHLRAGAYPGVRADAHAVVEDARIAAKSQFSHYHQVKAAS